MSDTSNSGSLKKTAKHSVIYAVGTILRRLTGFVMLPIYTQYLTPANYGTIALLTMAISIVSIIVGLRISQALFRYYMMAEGQDEKNSIVSTVLFTVMAGSLIGVVLLYSVSAPLSYLIFGSYEFVSELQLFSFTILLNAIMTTCLTYLRACRKPILFVSMSVIYLALQVIFNIVFVVIMELHVMGVIYSALCSGAFMALFLLAYTLTRVGFHYSREVAKRVIMFTLPLMVAAIGSFCVVYMDKYFLRVFAGLTEVGLYTLALRLSSIVTLVYEAFNMSWGAEQFEIVKRDNSREIFEQIFRYLAAAMFIVGAGVALFSQDILWLMAAPSFAGAGSIVPILVLAAIAVAFSNFNNFGIQLAERTRHMAESTWLKAGVALVCYLLLIPVLGTYGAAIGFLVGNLTELRWNYVNSKKYYDMELKWKAIVMMGLTSILFVSIGVALPINELTTFFIKVGLYLTLLVTFYLMPIWSDNERSTMAGLVRKCLPVK